MAFLPSLQQLRFLCALAEQGHFGRAAESCAVTQSTLSGGIKEIEARLGVALFERSHRHVMLTPVGKEIAARAQRLLVDAEELVGCARNAQEPLSGPLRLGIIPTVGPYVCPSADNVRLVRRFAKRGSGSSGLEFRRPAADAASVGLRWLLA
jgi:LysR family hydrogen peroxide-inducible transcriptional activator